MQDLYGNAVSHDPSNIPLSGVPLYIIGSGTPTAEISQVAPAPAAKPLPDLKTWSKAPNQAFEQTASGVHVTTKATNWGNLLKSPKISVTSNSCYLVRASVRTLQGGVGLYALDGTSGQRLTQTVGLFTVTGHDDFHPELKVKTGSSTEIQVVFTADNGRNPEVTEFEASDPQISSCYTEQLKP